MIDKVIEKSGNLIRKRLSQRRQASKGRKQRVTGTGTAKGTAKKRMDDVSMLINNLIARS